MASWRSFLAVCTVTHLFDASGDRSSARTGPEGDDTEATVQTFIKEGKEMFDKSSTMATTLDKMHKTDAQMQKAARQWAQGTYEAMKNARRIIVQNTNKAQNVLLHDALHVRAAAMGSFEHTVNKFRGEFTPKKEIKEKLAQLMKTSSVSSQPENMLPGYKSISVVITDHFGKRGDGLTEVAGTPVERFRGQEGQLVKFDNQRGKWLVSPDKPGLKDVWLDIGDFEVLDPYEQKTAAVPGLRGYRVDPVTQEALLKSRKAQLLQYAGNSQHVQIDDITECIQTEASKKWYKANQRNAYGEVVDYSPTTYKFQIRYQSADTGDIATNPLDWPWCPSSAFHSKNDFEGTLVKVKNPGWLGRVLRFSQNGPGGGSYDVEVLGAPNRSQALQGEEGALKVITMSHDDVQRYQLNKKMRMVVKRGKDLEGEYVKISTDDGKHTTGKIEKYADGGYVIDGAEFDADGNEKIRDKLRINEGSITSIHALDD